MGHGKAISVPHKAGSEPLPVSRGAAKLLVFKLSMFYAERKARMEGARKELCHPGRRKALVPLKLEVNFFQA
jgi:hypothetical protein